MGVDIRSVEGVEICDFCHDYFYVIKYTKLYCYKCGKHFCRDHGMFLPSAKGSGKASPAICLPCRELQSKNSKEKQ